MNIVMSGATGFVGGHLIRAFAAKGWRVMPLTRQDFDLDEQSFLKKCEGADVMINLAGAPIAARWTEEYKRIIYRSRIGTTMKMVKVLGMMSQKPRVFVSTSAIGIYDAKGVHTEDDRNYADTFLGRVALDWEQAALKTTEYGVRTVIFRCGVVLGIDGGALQKMLPAFKVGLGGTIGDGTQPFSWIHIEDLVRAYSTVIEDGRYEGIYNLCAPHPTSNEGLAKALGAALHRPSFMKVPLIALKLQFGEGAYAFLEGQSVVPVRLAQSGFVFKFTTIEEAVEDLVGR